MTFDFGIYTYFMLHILSLCFPLLRSFEHRIKYWKQWKYLWQGMIATAVFFIAFDIWFAYLKIWWFNTAYFSGIWIVNLPLEEWLFFIVVPFCCVFIYEAVGYYIKGELLKKSSKWITLLLVILLLCTSIFNYDRMYTFYKLGLAGIGLIIHWIVFKDRYLGKFYVSFFFACIPFLLYNGVLTSLPVVMYDNTENLNIRLSSLVGIPFLNIPIEDFGYNLLMLLMNVSFFEYFRQQGKHTTQPNS
jgi:lycopene cyclase domain-containing protein